MTADTKITVVEDYQDRSAIEAVVEELLEWDPEVPALLARKAPPPLVVVKPNWIKEGPEDSPSRWESLLTHPEVVLAVVAKLAERMTAEGVICVCDSPIASADFEAIVRYGDFRARLDKLRDRRPGPAIELLDLRREYWIQKEEVVIERRQNPSDPRGYVRVNLGAESMFSSDPRKAPFYGADYNDDEVNRHHHGPVHEYLLAGTPMSCDLFVNLPKLKTHMKSGITCCLKNLVGINGDKNWLPHFRQGRPRDGGDEFADDAVFHELERGLRKVGHRLALALPGTGTWFYRKARKLGEVALGDGKQVIRSGNWSGNDTCWRMVLDLNRALLYAGLDGRWRPDGRARKHLGLVDGIVGGEGPGPMAPDPIRARVLVAGASPAELDATACRLMGFAPERVPMIANAFGPHLWPLAARGGLEEVRVFDARRGLIIGLDQVMPAVEGGFRPHFGWSDLNSTAAAACPGPGRSSGSAP